MATVKRSSLTSVFLVCFVISVFFGAGCSGRVTQDVDSGQRLHRPGGAGGATRDGGRRGTDVSDPWSADQWRLLAGRIDAALRVLRSGHALDDEPSLQARLDRVLKALQKSVRRKDVPESPSAGHWPLLAQRLGAVLREMRSNHSSTNTPTTESRRRQAQRTVHRGVRHRRDAPESSSAGHWKLLARRLNTILRMMRSRQTARSSNTAPANVARNRKRRASSTDDKLAQEQAIADDIRQIEDQYGPRRKIAQQREIAREIEQIERDAGLPSDQEKLAQEEEIAREIKQIEERYGPAQKIAQQKEIARQIEQAEIDAGRAATDRRFEQQREIQREIEEIERKAGVPSHAEKLERERQIARIIESIEAQAKATQIAHERTVAGDIRAILQAHTSRHLPPLSFGSDSSSSESNESGDTAGTVADDVTDQVDDDPVYDDAFADSAVSSPLDEDGGDDDLLASDDASSPSAAVEEGVASGAPAPSGEGQARVGHSSWQVTVMTVIMCSIVGIVLLVVVGTWYRDLGFRPFRPGKPEHMLLDDDEQTVYNRTTQPEPRQVGTYSPLT